MLQTSGQRIAKTALAIDYFILGGICLELLFLYCASGMYNHKLFVLLLVAWLILTLILVVIWAVTHQLSKGSKYAFLHDKICRKLNTALYDSGIYVERIVLLKKCAEIPKLQIDLDTNLRTGVIKIRNCIKFDRRLDEMPISSALPDEYVVTRSYIADNCNDYVYEFELYKMEQLVFHSFAEFKTYSSSVDSYSLFLDGNRSISMFHVLVVGQTGAGKSYCLYNLILQMLSKKEPWELYLADPKASGIYVLGRHISPEHTAARIEEIIQLLEMFYMRMEERKEEFGEKLLLKLDSDYRDFGLCPICLIIDEYSSFRSSLARYDKKTRDRVDEIIGNIIREGRQIGCFCVLAQQQSNANNLPTELKENIPCKLILGMAERQTYITALGEYPEVAKRHFDRGQGLLVYPGIATPEMPAITSIATLDFDILAAVDEIKNTGKGRAGGM